MAEENSLLALLVKCVRILFPYMTDGFVSTHSYYAQKWLMSKKSARHMTILIKIYEFLQSVV